MDEQDPNRRKDPPDPSEPPEETPTVDRDPDLTQTSGGRAPRATEPAEIPGTIGSYRILGKLGEGGMGVVYEAEQQQPRRKVALKVVRGGQYVDEERIRLFQREAQALALLKHPNIGAIYESGRTDEGQHFFAMELVRGETLDAYLKERPLALAGEELELRLELFRKLADAVHYAHQRGVIHRDLKPSNIVVTADTTPAATGATLSSSHSRLPEIKILDFGLARMTDTDVAATMVSEIGVIKGTLAYMSPEQARGDPARIDVRADVYALGVILYEMLAGRRPYDVERTTLIDALRVICEQPPHSLRQRAVGARRLDSDLETIAGKALEKDPERRYDSAAALSEDVGRYLASQPILARPPSTAYQLRKLVSRNKLPAALAASLLVALVGFGAWMSVLYRRSESNLARALAAETEANREAETAGRVAGFMVELFEVADPGEARGNTITAREILDRGVARIDEGLGDQPGIQATLTETMGRVYRVLGLYKEARPLLEKAVGVRESEVGAEPLALASALNELSVVRTWLGEFEAGEDLARRALAIREEQLGENHPEVAVSLNALGNALQNGGKLAEAESAHRRAAAIREAELGPEHPDLAQSLHNLAIVRYFLGDYEEAEQLYRRAASIEEKAEGPDSYSLATSLHTLAILYQDLGRFAEAIPIEQRALAIREKVLGAEHPHVAFSLTTLGSLYIETGKPAEAESLLRRAAAIGEKTWGPRHYEVQWMKRGLARSLIEQGEYGEAESILSRMLAELEEAGEEEAMTAALNAMGTLRARQRRYGEAEEAFGRSLEIDEAHSGKDHPYLTTALAGLANVRRDQRRFSEAESLYRRALGILDAHGGPDSHDRRTLLRDLAECLEASRGQQP